MAAPSRVLDKWDKMCRDELGDERKDPKGSVVTDVDVGGVKAKNVTVTDPKDISSVVQQIQEHTNKQKLAERKALEAADAKRPNEHMWGYQVFGAGEPHANGRYVRSEHMVGDCPSYIHTEHGDVMIARQNVGWVLGELRPPRPLYGYQTEDKSIPLLPRWQAFEGRKPMPQCRYIRCEDRAAELKQEGNEAMKKQRYDQAEEKYTQALQLDPLSDEMRVVLYSNRSQLYLKQRQWEEALSDASRALDIDPQHEKSLLRKAKAAEKLERYEVAVSSLQQLLKHHPDNSEALTLKQETEALLKLQPRAKADIPPEEAETSDEAPPHKAEGAREDEESKTQKAAPKRLVEASEVVEELDTALREVVDGQANTPDDPARRRRLTIIHAKLKDLQRVLRTDDREKLQEIQALLRARGRLPDLSKALSTRGLEGCRPSVLCCLERACKANLPNALQLIRAGVVQQVVDVISSTSDGYLLKAAIALLVQLFQTETASKSKTEGPGSELILECLKKHPKASKVLVSLSEIAAADKPADVEVASSSKEDFRSLQSEIRDLTDVLCKSFDLHEGDLSPSLAQFVLRMMVGCGVGFAESRDDDTVSHGLKLLEWSAKCPSRRRSCGGRLLADIPALSDVVAHKLSKCEQLISFIVERDLVDMATGKAVTDGEGEGEGEGGTESKPEGGAGGDEKGQPGDKDGPKMTFFDIPRMAPNDGFHIARILEVLASVTDEFSTFEGSTDKKAPLIELAGRAALRKVAKNFRVSTEGSNDLMTLLCLLHAPLPIGLPALRLVAALAESDGFVSLFIGETGNFRMLLGLPFPPAQPVRSYIDEKLTDAKYRTEREAAARLLASCADTDGFALTLEKRDGEAATAVKCLMKWLQPKLAPTQEMVQNVGKTLTYVLRVKPDAACEVDERILETKLVPEYIHSPRQSPLHDTFDLLMRSCVLNKPLLERFIESLRQRDRENLLNQLLSLLQMDQEIREQRTKPSTDKPPAAAPGPAPAPNGGSQ